MTEPDNCMGCKFWKQHGARETAWEGQCRRHAPIAYPVGRGRDPETIFPLTRARQWCGDFDGEIMEEETT